MRRLLLAAAILLCITSTLGLIREYPAAVFARDPTMLKLDILLQPDVSVTGQGTVPGIPTIPLSWRGQRDLLLGCNDVQTDPLFKFMAPEPQGVVHQNCLKIAEQILTRAPTFGLAHLVQATAHSGLGNAHDRDAALVVAQKTAPHEGWQAIRRVQLGLPSLTTLDPRAQGAVAADLHFMMMTDWGVRQIAPLFVTHPNARVLIESVAQRADPVRQQQLINALRIYTQRSYN